VAIWQEPPRAARGFLRDRAANNRRAWFEANRDAHDRDCKAAGLDTVASLAAFCETAVPRLLAVPKVGVRCAASIAIPGSRPTSVPTSRSSMSR
jgi:hypothetical protein